MTEKQRTSGGFTDERMEIIMGRLLQAGVLLASAVVLVGGVMHMIVHRAQSANYKVFSPGPDKLTLLHPGPLFSGIAHGSPAAIIQLGMLLLIATPIARVLCAVVGFSIERDRLYVAVSTAVLAVLIWSLLHGS